MPARKRDIARLKRMLAETARIDQCFDKLAKEVNADKQDQLRAVRNQEYKKRFGSFN